MSAGDKIMEIINQKDEQIEALEAERIKQRERAVLAEERLRVSEKARLDVEERPVEIITHCQNCTTIHIDKGQWAVKCHRTHKCAICGNEWTPSKSYTFGVESL